MADVKQFEQLLQEQGFKPVPPAEVQRVEASVREKVAKPVAERLDEQQDEIEKARTWYVAGVGPRF
jgi:flavodoxin